jgi:hypothetical protein
VKYKHSQKSSLLRGAEDDRLAVPEDLQRPEYSEFHDGLFQRSARL